MPLVGELVVFPVTVSLISIAIGVAVLKYRLYDIDRVINRTLVYGLLTVLLGAVYAAGVFAAGRLLDPADGESELAVAASTLAVAALFQPARRRIQAVVDRRFNRRRYNAARTVEGFSGRLQDEIDLDTPLNRAARGGRSNDAAHRRVALASAIGTDAIADETVKHPSPDTLNPLHAIDGPAARSRPIRLLSCGASCPLGTVVDRE